MNDEPLDYYAILGVSREATEVDIKAAYHRQALRLHPDRNKDNEERANLDFKKVAEAYRVLSNSESKAAFDRHGHLKMHKLSHSDIFNTFSKIFGSDNKSATFSFQNQGSTFSETTGRKRPRPEFTSTPSITQHLADYFASISSGNIPGTVAENESEPPAKKPRFEMNGNNDSGFFSSGSSSSYTLGQTLQTTLDVTFDESVHGCTKHILIIRQDICLHCRGTGFTDINSNSNSSSGEYPNSPAQSSPRAPRSRSIACRECSNSGRVPREKQIRVDVPAGVIDGWKKIYKGEGDAPPKELGSYTQDAERLSYGNLIVVFKVESHPFLRRDPSNLIDVNCELPITFSQAAVGACLQIPTIYGSATIDIPSGTQPGTVIHLHKQGFTSLHDTTIRGDMHIKIALMVPSTLSAKQVELLHAFDQETENAHHNNGDNNDKKNEDVKESN